jgi:hypothetical protein
MWQGYACLQMMCAGFALALKNQDEDNYLKSA